mmetsp:Transcript_29525/g.73672  ORF Transcript_29525/g.73672 Transcript_29525/m.73672 type:complete len:231 (+) Transcript_29525:624-1316(+)
MLPPARAARVLLGPTLLSTRNPTVGMYCMKIRSNMIGCVASTTSSRPHAAPAAIRAATTLASNRLSFLPTVAPVAPAATAAPLAPFSPPPPPPPLPPPSPPLPARVSQVDCARVAPNMTRVCPWRPVAMGPGCATHTRTPRSATSPRSEWQNAASAAFVAAYVACPGAGHFTAMDPTATMHPERLASMEGRIALVMAMALMVLSSNMSRSTSSVVSSAAACCDPPATWNR